MLDIDTHVLLHAVAGVFDELIAATSLVHNARLLTRDRKLLGSKTVPLA